MTWPLWGVRRGAEGPAKVGISPGTLASAFLSRSLPLPSVVQSTVSLQASERAESSREEGALQEKHVFPDSRESPAALSSHVPWFTGYRVSCGCHGWVHPSSEPSSPPPLSCLLKKQKVCGIYNSIPPRILTIAEEMDLWFLPIKHFPLFNPFHLFHFQCEKGKVELFHKELK